MKEILQKITQDPKLESRWLNTLSLLEHIGARKISKTVGATHPSFEILEHFADEARHAKAFKELSKQLADQPDYLCAESGITYFQSLDHGLSEWLSSLKLEDTQRASYFLTTSMIERRAMKLYPLYQKTTSQKCVAEELEKVISEENNHRHFIDREAKALLERAGKPEGFQECLDLEDRLFAVFEGNLKKQIDFMFFRHPGPRAGLAKPGPSL